MSEQRILTPEEAQAEMLMQLNAIRKILDVIRTWVVFGGVILLIAIGLQTCNAILSL